MLTPYDKRQQARERAAILARQDLDAHLMGAPLAPSCDWDEAFAKLTGAGFGVADGPPC